MNPRIDVSDGKPWHHVIGGRYFYRGLSINLFLTSEQASGETEVLSFTTKPIILGELRDSPSRHYNVTVARGTCDDITADGKITKPATNTLPSPYTTAFIYLPQQKKRGVGLLQRRPLDSTAMVLQHSSLCPS
eukprot:scaffold197021_cov68-Attheya_sp.AAC.8